MVSAGRHKSDCRSTAGEDQQGLRFCGLWKGGVACSEAVQTMGARLARCRRVSGQRVARSHATVSVSPIRDATFLPPSPNDKYGRGSALAKPHALIRSDVARASESCLLSRALRRARALKIAK